MYSFCSDGVQSNNDTPPHTPPTAKPSQFGGGANSGYNSLHNGYSQMSPSPNLGEAGGVTGVTASAAASKMLMFNNMNNPSSFKMM